MRKYAMSYAFDPSKHPRDAGGQFSAKGGSDGAPSFRQRGLREDSPGPDIRRSFSRGEAWQRVGAKLSAMPPNYTGSNTREKPVGSFIKQPITRQIPKTMGVAESDALFRRLTAIVKGERAGAIEKALVTRQKVAVHGLKDRFTLKRRTGDFILPADAPRSSVNKAFNHAAMLALHDTGTVKYGPDFKMDDDLKAELTPLVPFMRFVRRRIGQEISRREPGVARAHLSDFGQRFPTPKFDRKTGKERLRFAPNMELIKAWDETRHPRGQAGKFGPGSRRGQPLKDVAEVSPGGKPGSAIQRPAKKEFGPIAAEHAASAQTFMDTLRAAAPFPRPEVDKKAARAAILERINAERLAAVAHWAKNLHLGKRLLTEAEVRAAARSSGFPTDAQAKAGNYRKGHLSVAGLPVSIETAQGRIRRGKGWSVRQPAHYGYVKGTLGADGDHVDVYLGSQAHKADSLPVHVVNQRHPVTGSFDEHKAMVGFRSRAHAVRAYDAAFSDGSGPARGGEMTTIPFASFKEWLKTGDTTKPLGKADTSGALDPRVAAMLPVAHRTVAHASGRALLDPHVAKVLPHAHRLVRGYVPPPPPKHPGEGRLARTAAVADHRKPLAHLLRA